MIELSPTSEWTCCICGAPVAKTEGRLSKRARGRRKVCGSSCRGRLGAEAAKLGGSQGEGAANPAWRGGSYVHDGRRFIRVGIGHELAGQNGYALEHRVVAQTKIGRPLGARDIVHHVDMDGLNNDPTNLAVAHSRTEHVRWHASLNPLVAELMRRGILGFNEAEGYVLIEDAA